MFKMMKRKKNIIGRNIVIHRNITDNEKETNLDTLNKLIESVNYEDDD